MTPIKNDGSQFHDFGDVEAMTRSELQNALRQWGLPSGGSNIAIKERYTIYRNSKIGINRATGTTTAATTGASSAKKKSPPPTAAAKTQKKKKKAAAEKRLKRFRSSPPKNVRDRIERAKTQRMFLVQKGDTTSGNLSCKFVVLGSTGNIYDVMIQQIPQCTCPDHRKGNLCKHILFVLLKVMAIDPTSPLIYQAAWLTSELEEMFDRMSRRFQQVSGSVLANSKVRETFAKLEKGEDHDNDSEEEDPNVARRQEVKEDDDCPICFDSLHGNGRAERTTFCRAQCGANFHLACIETWLKQHRAKPTCPMCRQAWDDGKKSSSETPTKEGFTNLGQLQGQSQVRDTSTYSNYWSPSSRSNYKRRRRR